MTFVGSQNHGINWSKIFHLLGEIVSQALLSEVDHSSSHSSPTWLNIFPLFLDRQSKFLTAQDKKCFEMLCWHLKIYFCPLQEIDLCEFNLQTINTFWANHLQRKRLNVAWDYEIKISVFHNWCDILFVQNIQISQTDVCQVKFFALVALTFFWAYA